MRGESFTSLEHTELPSSAGEAAFKKITVLDLGPLVQERCRETGGGLERATKMIRGLMDYEDRLEDLH